MNDCLFINALCFAVSDQRVTNTALPGETLSVVDNGGR